MFIQTFFFNSGSLRKNLWDAEDRLRAVDLSPENDADKPLVAIYTYDAGGERTIKYVPARIDARYSAKEAGSADRLEAMIYPSALLTAKILPIPEEGYGKGGRRVLKYTKHYYASTSLSTGIGSERIASFLGTKQDVGLYCDSETTLIPPMDAKVLEAGAALGDVFAYFDKTFDLDTPYLYGSGTSVICGPTQITQGFGAYWYHPDHLGSSSYITNLNGEISQHMEYLPFGETLVEEHLNSYNSPYKFNAKEFDAETGNYYYGARYYSPKYNLMLSVDPLYEMFPGISPYAYVLNNPIRYTDPTGMAAEDSDCGIGCSLRKIFNTIFHPNDRQNPDGTLSRKKSRATGWDLSQKKGESGRSKEKNSETKGKTTVASVLDRIGIVPQIFIPQVDIQLSSVIINPISSFVIDGRTFNIVRGQPQNINFNFSTIGGVAHIWDGTLSEDTNRILPLINSQQQNLQAIANYLIANPQATIRFQYPTPLNSSHPNFNADIREVYQMNFSQMTNYLIKQGVTDPNRRILMNYGKSFDFIVNPGN